MRTLYRCREVGRGGEGEGLHPGKRVCLGFAGTATRVWIPVKSGTGGGCFGGGGEGGGRSAICTCVHVRTAEGGGGGGCGKAYDMYVHTGKDCCMVPAVRDWAIGVPKPLTLVEPATRTGLERLGRVQRVTNSWERVYSQGRWERVYIQGKRVCLGFASSARPILGSIPHLMAVPYNLPRGFGSRSNKVFIYLNIPTLSRGTVV